MAPESAGEITELLGALQRGDDRAKSRLVALVYAELRRRAAYYMSRERRDHTLQPTELVNEAYLRIFREGLDFQNRAHFFAIASNAMRHFLVDYARMHDAARRPDGRAKVELREHHAVEKDDRDRELILAEAIQRLAEMDARQAKMVEMIYYGGLTQEEAAVALGVSVRTVKRDWESASAWLKAELKRRRE